MTQKCSISRAIFFMDFDFFSQYSVVRLLSNTDCLANVLNNCSVHIYITSKLFFYFVSTKMNSYFYKLLYTRNTFVYLLNFCTNLIDCEFEYSGSCHEDYMILLVFNYTRI